MKRKLFFLIFILTNISIFAIRVNVNASVETARYTTSGNSFDLISGSGESHSYVKPIYTANVEILQDIEYGQFGIGVGYEQGYERRDGETFSTIPLYGIAKLKMDPLYLSAKYGTTFYTQLNTDSTYKNAEYLSVGLGLDLGNSVVVEGSVKANTVERNGVKMGTISYGLSMGINTY